MIHNKNLFKYIHIKKDLSKDKVDVKENLSKGGVDAKEDLSTSGVDKLDISKTNTKEAKKQLAKKQISN